MCCCGKPVVNGEPGYKWQPNDPPMVRPANPPPMEDGDALLFDEPGRCGGTDSHSYHYRVVLRRGSVWLLVRHGGGDENCVVGYHQTALDGLHPLTSDQRYWLLSAIYHARSTARRDEHAKVNSHWRQAAAEKRIRTRKQRGRDEVKVWIEPARAAIAKARGG
jgi:hypothetical protein